MGTASTKSRGRNRKRAARVAQAEEAATTQPASTQPPSQRARKERETEAEPPSLREIPEWLWRAASALILVSAAAFRIYNYGLKPFHHDEGVNGFFLINLVRNHVYHYDPSNYHGPTLYYFALATSFLFGLNDFAVRLVPAIFGIGTVWLMLTFRRYIGTVGALTAAALVAVSPASVFYSRYFIHEALFVFFSVAIVAAALSYYETARPIYLMLAAASAALLFATKETAMITAGVFIIALFSTEIYRRMRNASKRKRRKRNRPAAARTGDGLPEPAWSRFGERQDLIWLGAAALGLFIFLHVLFYSSFFTHAKGVTDSLATFKIWVRTGTSEFHAKPFWTYFKWLWQEESMLLLLGGIGVLVAFKRATNRFAIFCALWAVGIILAYSLVPYKTPWLVLSFIPPLAISAGYAVNRLYQLEDNTRVRAFALGLVLLAVSVGVYQSVQLNFYQYDNEQYPYVYAHTQRSYLALIKEINEAARRAGTVGKTSISIASPDYWPMPWYLREFVNAQRNSTVAYPGRVGSHNEQIVVCSGAQEAECQAALSGRYRRVGSYPLRGGVTLILYLRNDVP